MNIVFSADCGNDLEAGVVLAEVMETEYGLKG
jgi:hypothetical protein